jgi:hypothetical protein
VKNFKNSGFREIFRAVFFFIHSGTPFHIPQDVNVKEIFHLFTPPNNNNFLNLKKE